MDRNQLLELLRRGNAWRYADGLAAPTGPHPKKENATEAELLKASGTCISCGGKATNEEIEQAVTDAANYDDFRSIILNCIEHSGSCFGRHFGGAQ